MIEKEKLYFLYSTELIPNKYLSVVNGIVLVTYSYRDTCLYTINELIKVKQVLDSKKIKYEYKISENILRPPVKFILPIFKKKQL
jgi:hypothetical protein